MGRDRQRQGPLAGIGCDPNSRTFHNRKRAEGKRQVQTVLAPARRRVSVQWALIRDGRCHPQ